MTEFDQSKLPIYLRLINAAEGDTPAKYSLNMTQLKELFQRQAKLDVSEDEPKLLPESIFEVTPEGLYLVASYTISDLQGGRTNLVIEGCINNDSKGFLSEDTLAKLSGNEQAIQRTLVAFGVTDNLPLKTFLQAMIEDSLQGKIHINNSSLEGNNLVLEFVKLPNNEMWPHGESNPG